MKTLILSLFLSLLSTNVFAETGQLINVFYSPKNEGFQLNIDHPKVNKRYLFVKSFLLTSQSIEACVSSLCESKIAYIDVETFDILINGAAVARVSTNDRDNLLPAKAFTLIEENNKTRLLLDLDILKEGPYKYSNPCVESLVEP